MIAASDEGEELSEIEYPARQMIPHETVEKLQAMIRKGHFGPDERLPSQRQLSNALGISRPTLREAISILETIGLVRVEVGRGVFVNKPEERAPRWRNLGQTSPREAYELRYCVEGYAAGLTASRITPALLDGLLRCHEVMCRAADVQDVVTLASNDRTFHDTIMRGCGNSILIESYLGVHRMILETQRVPMGRLDLLQSTTAEHWSILLALQAGDISGSARAMMKHIAATAARAGVEIMEFPQSLATASF